MSNGIIYSMVGRCPECVLAEVCGGKKHVWILCYITFSEVPVSEGAGLIDLNPSSVARKILKTIEGQQNTKMSYVYSKYAVTFPPSPSVWILFGAPGIFFIIC